MDLFPTPANPAPPDAIVTPVRTADDLLLRVVRWVPQGEPLGTVVVIQGRTEFIEKYFEVAGELLARGFVVVAMDWRGQGLSDRDLNDSRKGHVDDFAFFERDLDALHQQVLQFLCPEPWFALGHSMGGAILLAQARAGRSPFARMVLTAPMIDIAGLRFPRLVRALMEGLDMVGLGTRLRSRRLAEGDAGVRLCGQRPHLRSGPLRAARAHPRGGAATRPRRPDRRLAERGFPVDG